MWFSRRPPPKKNHMYNFVYGVKSAIKKFYCKLSDFNHRNLHSHNLGGGKYKIKDQGVDSTDFL